MTMFEKEINKPEYDFLTKNEHLGSNIILLGLGGSHAYGTAVETSDIDIRGVARNTKTEILLGEDFEQVDSGQTDTVIYSLNKMIKLLVACNPNVIEILGLKPEHYLKKTELGQLLIDNREMFLSKVAIQSFGGYATSQLRRLDNKAGRIGDAHNQTQHIVNSMNNAKYAVQQLITPLKDGDAFDLKCIDDQIFTDLTLHDYPLDDALRMIAEVMAVRNDYKKLGMRNSKAIEHGKIGKHMMHLVRVMYMCFDILEKKQIKTYRDEEHDLLMYIRNNGMLDAGGQPTDEFWQMMDDLDKRFEYAKQNTELPDRPDMKKINDFKMEINEKIVKGLV